MLNKSHQGHYGMGFMGYGENSGIMVWELWGWSFVYGLWDGLWDGYGETIYGASLDLSGT